ncbi:MAG: helix-turn-helix transcriptional regulator [Armatimonadetes bacterium]|nr:helix-turn-helix transcriptional regulator [Armatimonadota bacterium]
MSLGAKIAELRRGKNLKQSDLAALLHVHPTHVTRWERDRVKPRGKALAKLAEALGVPSAELQAVAEEEEIRSRFEHVPNRRLAELLGQIHKLDPKDQEVLQRILETMLTRIELEAVLQRSSPR